MLIRGRMAAGLVGFSSALALGPSRAADPAPRLLIAFSSYRDNLGYPQSYFYRHDGIGSGMPDGSIPAGTTRSDHRPALAAHGRLCAWTQEFVGLVCLFVLWVWVACSVV